jgi:flagellar biosynthesis/type III secretory pathway protein FliH
MSKRNEGWGCLFSIIVVSIFFVLIIPKSKKADTYGTNNKTRMEYEKTKQDQQKYDNDKLNFKMPQSDINAYQPPTYNSYSSNTPDDAYSEGYDEGYEQGKYDGSHGYGHGYGYDDSSSYYNYYETKYQEGYEEGYDEGYYKGQSIYKEAQEKEDDM